jgi:peptidyl-prolyl cis-trans isomerase A (cyclophilin A)
MRRTFALAATLVLSTAACQKATDAGKASGAAKPEPSAPPPAGGQPAPTPAPTPTPAPAPPVPPPSNDDVRAPVAADLATYSKDIPGDGPLAATIETSLGTFECALFADKVPMTVANFVGLATGKKPWADPQSGAIQKGKPLYDGLTFHRVISDFMIQGGDPLGIGAGGPGYNFDDEFVEGLGLDKAGVLAMANAGPGTNGSQFFITEKATPWLTGHHTVFGQCEPADLVKKITSVPKGPGDKPTTPVTMKITIHRAK